MSAELSPRAWLNIATVERTARFTSTSKLSSYIDRLFVMSLWGRLDLGYLDSEGIRIQTGVYTIAESVERVFSDGPPIMLYDVEGTLPAGLVKAITKVIPFECLCDQQGGKHVCR